LILKLWYNDNCDELICVSRNDNAIHVDVNTWSFATNFVKTSVFYAGVFFVCEKTESPISHCGNVLCMFYHEEGMNTVVEIILKRTMIYDLYFITHRIWLINERGGSVCLWIVQYCKAASCPGYFSRLDNCCIRDERP